MTKAVTKPCRTLAISRSKPILKNRTALVVRTQRMVP
jgi:hypothetical protein